MYISLFANKGQKIGCLGIIEHEHLYLVNKQNINCERQSIVQLQILSDTKYNI